MSVRFCTFDILYSVTRDIDKSAEAVHGDLDLPHGT